VPVSWLPGTRTLNESVNEDRRRCRQFSPCPKRAAGRDCQPPLEAWRLQFPGCNWGLACGPDFGVFVLDVAGVEQFTESVGWKPSTVRQKVWRREIEFVRIGRTIRLRPRPETAENLIERGTVPALKGHVQRCADGHDLQSSASSALAGAPRNCEAEVL
jgi:hypothetical protein